MAFGKVKVCPLVDGDATTTTYSIFWLDADVYNTDDNQQTQQRLRSILKAITTFDDSQKCIQAIESYNDPAKIIFIVSGGLGRNVVPTVHNLPQIVSIYVFCFQKELNEEWAKKYSKVGGCFFDRMSELVVLIIQGQGCDYLSK